MRSHSNIQRESLGNNFLIAASDDGAPSISYRFLTTCRCSAVHRPTITHSSSTDNNANGTSHYYIPSKLTGSKQYLTKPRSVTPDFDSISMPTDDLRSGPKDFQLLQKSNSRISRRARNARTLYSHTFKELKLVQKPNSSISRKSRNPNFLRSYILMELKAVHKFNSRISRGASLSSLKPSNAINY